MARVTPLPPLDGLPRPDAPPPDESWTTLEAEPWPWGPIPLGLLAAIVALFALLDLILVVKL